MAGQKLLMAIITTVMIATACGPSVDNGSADLPPAPEVRGVRSSPAIVLDDGLVRVIVTIPDATSAATIDRSDGDSSIIIGELESGVGSDPLRRDALLGLPAGSTLLVRDGVLGYTADDGLFVPLGDESEGELPTVAFDDQTDVATLMRSIPGVESVRPITESTYAVTATSVEGLAALGVEITEDAPLAFSNDPYKPYQWALENDGENLSGVALAEPPSQSPDADVDGLEARDGATGRGIVVAIVDAGVDFGHPDLAHARWANGAERCDGASVGVDDDGNGFVDDCFGWDFGDEDALQFDGTNDEHGTHVAGIIAAKTDNNIGVAGIAPDVKIMDLKVSDSSGVISSSSIARAIHYAADNGADVVNLSLGTDPGASLASVAAISDAVDYAGTKGVLLVTAAGNSGISLDSSPVYPASFDAANLLTVGASTPSDRRASFSNTGTDVDLFAPGDLILSTIPGDDVAFMSGTSQAAPIVAATAALMLERDGAVSPSTLIDQMVRASDSLESLDGLASNPVRLNSARTLGIEADIPGEGDTITIRGLETDVDGLVSAQVSIGELGGQFNQQFHWEASLLTLVDGEPFAVTNHPVSVRDIEGGQLRSSQTDQRGAVLLADKEASSAGWSTTLPNGSYALLIEAVPHTDPTVRLGDGFIARFDVGQLASGETGSGSGTDDSSGASSDGTSGGSAGPGTTSDDVPDAGDVVSVAPAGSGSGSGSGDLDSSDTSVGNTPLDGSDGAASTTGADAEPTDGTGPDGAGSENQESSDDVAPTETIASGDAPGAENSTGSGDEGEGGDGEIALGPDEVSDGPWSITSVTPRTGPTDTVNLVVIDGTFPEDAVTWFGDQPGETVYQSNGSILVETPRHAAAETVDVRLRTRDGEVLVLPDGYAFVRAGENPSSESPTSGSSGSAGDGGSSTGAGSDSQGETTSGTEGVDDEPTFDNDPGEVIGAGQAPPADASGDSDGEKSRNRQARANTIGAPRLLPNGLTGVPMSGLDTIGGVPKCDEALCRTRRI